MANKRATMGLETGWIRTSGRVSRRLLGTFAWKEA